MSDDKKDDNDVNRAKILRLQIGLIVLQIIRAVLDLRWIALIVILWSFPVAPYMRVSQADASSASACAYVGSRGMWEPGWTSQCPRVALRHHFYAF